MKRYIITGGTSSGKTATLLALEIEHGHHAIRESAEPWIRLQMSKGIKEPWKDLNEFQDNIARIDMEWEERFKKNHPEAKLFFKDRSVIDCLAFFRAEGMEPTKFALEAVEKMGKYDKVFLLDNLGFLEENFVRREDLKKAQKLGKLHKEIYEELGYEVVIIPKMPAEDRVNLILEHVEKDMNA